MISHLLTIHGRKFPKILTDRALHGRGAGFQFQMCGAAVPNVRKLVTAEEEFV